MSQCPLWLSEADVVALMTLHEAIDALEQGLQSEARGAASNLEKTHVSWGRGGTLHAIGAAFPEAGFAGTKTWAHTSGGATPLLILFDSTDGSLKAIIEAFALGQMRTGGISAVATRWLATENADELAVIGTGKQALTQVAAVAAVRRLRRVRVFSPNPQHRAAFVGRLRSTLECPVVEAASVAQAVEGAPIITLITRATTPFLDATMVARGSHINAVGAITAERAEFTADVLRRCDVVVTDSLGAAQRLSREFMEYYGGGAADWAAVTRLSALVSARRARPADADLSLFKAMGMGISDLSLGIEVYNRAVRRGMGHRFAPPEGSRSQ
jgi:alanine dehydrogenase